MKGVLSWSVGLSLCAGTSDFCPALVAVTSPVQNMFFLTVHYISVRLLPLPSKLGRHPVLGHLSLNVCLWPGHQILYTKIHMSE
jgi:hypothetical protein